MSNSDIDSSINMVCVICMLYYCVVFCSTSRGLEIDQWLFVWASNSANCNALDRYI